LALLEKNGQTGELFTVCSSTLSQSIGRGKLVGLYRLLFAKVEYGVTFFSLEKEKNAIFYFGL
tara:strand:- start:189 stop:377 length:189 start_codon:yes stop_codon:yes gene_type:complete